MKRTKSALALLLTAALLLSCGAFTGVSQAAAGDKPFAEGDPVAFDNADWIVYDHYDKSLSPTNSIFDDPSKRQHFEALDLDSLIPASWTTIAGNLGTPEKFKTAQRFRAHIYPTGDEVYFAGYAASGYTDFMIYPQPKPANDAATAVSFNIKDAYFDAHTLTGAGFFINAGIDAQGYLHGYFIYLTFTDWPLGTSRQAVELHLINSVSLYKIKPNVKAADVHGNNNNWTTYMQKSIRHPDFAQLITQKSFPIYQPEIKTTWDIRYHDELLFVAAREHQDGAIFQTLFDSKATNPNINLHTGYYGYGPFVDYMDHSCTMGTVFCFENVVLDPDSDPDPEPFPDEPQDPRPDLDYGEEALAVGAKRFTFAQAKSEGNANNPKVPKSAQADPGSYIDLNREVLVASQEIQAYSTDGGKSWTTLKDGEEIPLKKLLDKDLELWLCCKSDTGRNGYNPNSKKPEGSAEGGGNNIIAFSPINARPAAPKLAVNYSLGADPTGSTAGQWLLLPKEKADDPKLADVQPLKDLIQVAAGDVKNKNKTPATEPRSRKVWGRFFPGDTRGVPVKPLTGDKPEKSVYFARLAPTEDKGVYTAASKPVKLGVLGEGKAPKAKLDYKTETLKLKTGLIYSVNNGATYSPPAAGANGKAEPASIAANITSGLNLKVKVAATPKKPSSAAQVIPLAPRAVMSGLATAPEIILPVPADGKLKLNGTYEVYNKTTKKWGKLPKLASNGTYTFDIRIKPTAKMTKTGFTGAAASLTKTLTVTYGELTPGSGKFGVTSAKIEQPPIPA